MREKPAFFWILRCALHNARSFLLKRRKPACEMLMKRKSPDVYHVRATHEVPDAGQTPDR